MKDYKETETKKKFRLFDMNRDGKGVYEVEDRKPTLGFFFKLLWRKLSAILQLNILMLIHVIPILLLALAYFSGDKTPTITGISYPALYGINSIVATGSTPLLDISSINMGIPVFSPTFIWIVMAFAVIWVATFGWQCVGSAYVLRGLFRGDPVFVFSDFFYGIKKNFKQGFVMGLIDALIITVLAVDFIFFRNNGMGIMYFVIFALIIIYLVMRFYIYLLLITFELKTFKILKNALIFTVLGIKRNLIAFLGIILLLLLNVFLIVWLIPIGIALPLILPLVYLFGTLGFITTYAAYPVIDKYMIAPYVGENKEINEVDN